MRYMVIETFTKGPRPIYERAAKDGRMLPEGLTYLDSWIEAESLERCRTDPGRGCGTALGPRLESLGYEERRGACLLAARFDPAIPDPRPSSTLELAPLRHEGAAP
jgi:hypothetical protein